MAISTTSLALLLAVAAASNGVAEAANLRQMQRHLGASYVESDEFACAMIDRVNKERAAEGLPPVCANTKLQSSSQRHTDDMAANNYMAHNGTDGSTMSQRITDAKYDWSAVGENVAAGQEDVEAVMDAWMHSPEHRENIMGDYTMLGVAYAYNDATEYKHYWTQDFGKGENEACDAGANGQSQNEKETPVPKTAVFVTEAPETPCPNEEKTETPVQEATPAPTSHEGQETTPAPTSPEVQEATPAPTRPEAETPAAKTPEAQLSSEETKVPSNATPASDCEPQF
jgi:uncharacterized protein YkwD